MTKRAGLPRTKGFLGCGVFSAKTGTVQALRGSLLVSQFARCQYIKILKGERTEGGRACETWQDFRKIPYPFLKILIWMQIGNH